jgi:hypothetical protein
MEGKGQFVNEFALDISLLMEEHEDHEDIKNPFLRALRELRGKII